MEGRTYTYQDKAGHSYDVTQGHIDTAIEIYEELSKASRSKRVSWAQHKRMMEKAGYHDSGTSESYRQLIKRNRKKQGVLPTVERHYEEQLKGARQALEEEIGEIASAKLEANDNFTSLQQLKREINREMVWLDTIVEAVKETDWGETKLAQGEYVEKTSVNRLATLNDMHYGYDVHGYSTVQDLENSLSLYAQVLIDEGLEDGVETYHITNLGDLIENHLHAQTRVDAKLSSAKQVVGATKLVSEFLNKLGLYFNVKYYSLIGNHDRLEKRYKEAIDEESYITIHNAMLESKFEDSESVTIMKTDSPYYHILEIDGINIFLTHGDRIKVKDRNILSRLSTDYGVDLDVLLTGHLHEFMVQGAGYNKATVITGSFKMPDRFAERIQKFSEPSQVVIDFYEDTYGDDNYKIRQIKV